MWTRLKPWLRRFLGVTLNSLALAFFALPAFLDFLGTSVDWEDIVGADKAKFIIPTILGINIFLRAFVTKTKGSPEVPE